MANLYDLNIWPYFETIKRGSDRTLVGVWDNFNWLIYELCQIDSHTLEISLAPKHLKPINFEYFRYLKINPEVWSFVHRCAWKGFVWRFPNNELFHFLKGFSFTLLLETLSRNFNQFNDTANEKSSNFPLTIFQLRKSLRINKNFWIAKCFSFTLSVCPPFACLLRINSSFKNFLVYILRFAF